MCLSTQVMTRYDDSYTTIWQWTHDIQRTFKRHDTETGVGGAMMTSEHNDLS